MKTIILSAFTLFSATAFGQISLSGRSHLLFPINSASWKNIKQASTAAYEQKGKNNIGFNVGFSGKINLPTSLYLMPELYFTSFKNEYEDRDTDTTLQAKTNRLDVPVLLGYNLWGETLGAFLGPVFSYNFGAKDEEYLSSAAMFAEQAKKKAGVRFQIGAQAKISRLIVDARYEGAFTKDQRKFIKNIADSYETVNYDSRPSLFMIGLGYNF